MDTHTRLPDGRSRHVTGAFVMLTHRGRRVRVHLDALADRSRFVANVVDIAGDDAPSHITVPDSVDPAGFDAFLCIIYHRDPDAAAAAPPNIAPTLDALAFFDATPDAFVDYDAFVAQRMTVADAAAHFEALASAIEARLGDLLPKTWETIAKVRRPANEPPPPKHPAAFRKLEELTLPDPPSYYVVPVLANELAHRRANKRPIASGIPRRKNFLVDAINDDNRKLLAEAMGLPSITTLRAFYGAMQHATRHVGRGAEYAMTYHGGVIKWRDNHEIMRETLLPPVIPEQVDLSQVTGVVSSWGPRYVRFLRVSQAQRFREALASFFYVLPPRLEDLPM